MAGEAFATGAAANVVSSILKKIVQEVQIVISLPQAINDMETQVQRLKNVIDDIKGELIQEQRNPKQIVKIWLDKADDAITRSESIGKEYQRGKTCLGCCPNCICRYRIGKNIKDWIQIVDKLHSEKQSDFPSNGDYGDFTPPTQIPIEIPESGFTGNVIRTAQSKLETWLTEDSNNNIRIIGVYGMGGVGKTSLLQSINNSRKVSNSFDLIIWVTVSKEYDILDLQSCIADRLKLNNFPDKSNFHGRKNMTCSYLKRKRFLLILDDMWKSLELENLGVPALNERGYKVVITTRDKGVCSRMQAEEMIVVHPLSEDEGWQMFRRRAFGNGDVPPDIEDVAREIAGECKGLPLAINVVGSAMAHYAYPHEWELALHQMQTIDETFYDIHDEIEEKLFQHLKWSYNVLPHYLKTCFVYFAGYPEDRVIRCEEVIEMWIAEGLEGLVKSGEQSYLHDTAHSFISFLRDRCLIEATHIGLDGRIVQVKIHDVLRDLATLIAQKEQKCFFRAGQNLRDFPVEEDSKGWVRMSFVSNHIRSLPKTFACSSLSVLSLSGNRAIKEVPGSFLQGMPSLRVLNLSETRITYLPPCIGDLKHLASLQLSFTAIRELPETIGDLNQIQFLNVGCCCKLRCLPQRITELKCLRALDIRGCTKLSFLPRGISELVSLERFKMKMSFPLDFEDANAERSHACLKDLQSLRGLRNLHVDIKTPVKEGVMGNWSKMRNLYLNFNLANQDYLPQDMTAMKDHLQYFWLLGCDVERLPSWVSVFRKLSYLELSSCKRLKELPAELYELPGLRWLSMANCDALNELELGRRGCFPKLEGLTLSGLESLESIEAAPGSGSSSSKRGGLGEGALPMLKSVSVYRCEKLKTLPLGWDKLKWLEEIRGERDWWDAIQWQDVNTRTSLETKFKE